MGVTRRSLLFGAVAVPAGVVLPKYLLEELTLPAPIPEVGQKLIINPDRMRRGGSFIRYSDLMHSSDGITLLDDDGKVLGTFFATSMQYRMEPNLVDMSWGQSAYPGPTYIDLTLRRTG